MQNKYSNETMELLYERGSCRQFLDKDIPDEVLDEVIGAGLHAATGGNLQPYTIIKISEAKNKEKLVKELEMQSFVQQAPVNLLFCIDFNYIGRWAKASHAPYVATKSSKHFWIAFQDTIIAAQNICTAADSVGLGSVYVGTVESCFMELKEMCNLPDGVFPVVLLSLGYPVKKPIVKNKLGINALVHNEQYKDLEIDELMKLQDEKYDHKQFPASEGNIKQIYEVAEELGGKEYADDMIEFIKSAGHVNMAQRYFGLHYLANWMAAGNSRFIEVLKASGFPWIDGTDFPKKKF